MLAPKDPVVSTVPGLPRELEKVMHPEYRIEPPDILVVEAYKGSPKPPHRIEPLDVLSVTNSEPGKPFQGVVSVDAEGMIDLAPEYLPTKGTSKVLVLGKTTDEAVVAIERYLLENVGLVKGNVKVSVGLAQTRAMQRVSGTHLVQADGTIGIGSYGSVSVTGLTLAEAKAAIEKHLAAYLLDPGVSVNVQGFNSKLIYVIQDGGGAGQTVMRLPCTGNETVLDAISQVNGLSAVSSTDRIWVARPAGADCPHQILPVRWNAVVSGGETATNYQLFPGDRIFVASQPIVRADIRLARVLAPIERVFGIILLGNGTIRSLTGQQANFGGGF